MSDFKSKLPNFNEISSIASKLFKDVKTSVTEIIDDFKNKRESSAVQTPENSSVNAANIKPDPSAAGIKPTPKPVKKPVVDKTVTDATVDVNKQDDEI